ncbi:hypothetical protein [Actinosynnema sp.]|uniref:hypothetical protein n=1 Tax=Actinosynnema sp. TaxID=1872144 RepID=UPI003F861CEC
MSGEPNRTPANGERGPKQFHLALAASAVAALVFGVALPSHRADGFEVAPGPIITIALALLVFQSLYSDGGVRADRESGEAALREAKAERAAVERGPAGPNAPGSRS